MSPASRSLALARWGRSTVIVPYCVECHGHAAAVTTRTLATALASGLSGLTLALALPFVLPWLPLGACVLIALGGALGPIALMMGVRRRPRPGHVVAGKAVWWIGGRTLFCAQRRFAVLLGSAGGSREATRREPVLSAWMWIGPIATIALAVAVHRLHHPLVRVVNLTSERLEVLVDGRHVAWIAPTSAESPAAGVELQLPAGERRLQARSADGATLQVIVVQVMSGATHLYAPASTGYCFWLERTGYGRVGSGREIVPLSGDQRFWVLTDRVDSWFLPNPQPADDARSTGGSLIALRQAPCSARPTGF